jgi:hypothetical protein
MIRSTRRPEEKQGNVIVFGSGTQIPFIHLYDLNKKEQDDGRFEFQTGLEERHIRNSPVYSEEEKNALVKQQKEDLKELYKAYRKEQLDPLSQKFWQERQSFKVTNETLDTFFDTKNPEHLLLYWRIVSGGYPEGIGPSFEIASQYGLSFFLTLLEEQSEREAEEVGFKGKAYALLEEISEQKNTGDLLWLTWILLDSQSSGYSKSTPKATLYKALFEFIEGKKVKKGKKLCAKQFTDAAKLLKLDRTRAIATAVIKAGDHFGIIFSNKEGQLETRNEHLILGPSVEEAIETLLKPTNHEILEALRSEIEDKLK